MTSDPTESVRRALVDVINTDPDGRSALERAHGQVWDSDELRADFDVLGFMAPFIIVSRKSDGQKGTLMFQHDPRLYFGWQADR